MTYTRSSKQNARFRFPLLLTLIASQFVSTLPNAAQCGSPNLEAELAEMDAAAATLGTIRSWVNNEPEAAIDAFKNNQRVRQYLDGKLAQYTQSSKNRAGDRHAAIVASIREWDAFIPNYKESEAKQIASELKRQRDAVERYRKSKSPRPSSFAYIPKTVWQTKDKLDVLTASGVDTQELQAEQKAVQKLVLELLETLDPETIAKKNGYVRDAYQQLDRSEIESRIKEIWSKQHSDIEIVRIIMPRSSWSSTYGARIDSTTGRLVPIEVDRMTVYVATAKNDTVLTLHPIRLMRQNYRVNGKRLGKFGPQKQEAIPTNEFPFDVLESNIR
ncbi:MAG: hypothetical protein AAF664_06280 [Planctomycetota bacterium]